MRWLCPKCRAGFDEHRERCPADGSRLVENLSGRIVGSRWSVERLLGVGGGATVWAAMGLETKRPVAIKLARSTDLAEVRRFERGARISGMLDHPHITRVIEHGRDGEYAILVMEQLEGETLKRRIARHRTVTVAEAVHIVAQVLDALDYAHFHGIVHRDIKPSNLFITPTTDDPNFVKILDWGIAKFVDGEPAAADLEEGEHEGDDGLAVTQAQQILGTPEFMAPEQIVGGNVDTRSDIYAVGIVLYRLLAGHHPFEAKSRAEMYHAHLMKEVPPLPPGLVAGLDAVVRRALAKRPEDRWGNAGAMRRALLAVMGAPVSMLGPLDTSSSALAARPPEPDTTLNERAAIGAALTPPAKPRRRGLVIGAVAIAAAAALALIIALPGSGTPPDAPLTAGAGASGVSADQIRVAPAEPPARPADNAAAAPDQPPRPAIGATGAIAPAVGASAPGTPDGEVELERPTEAQAALPTPPSAPPDPTETPAIAPPPTPSGTHAIAPASASHPPTPPAPAAAAPHGARPEPKPAQPTPPPIELAQRPTPTRTPPPSPAVTAPIYVDRGSASPKNVAATPTPTPVAASTPPAAPQPAPTLPSTPAQPVLAVAPTPAPTPAPVAPTPRPNVVDAEPAAPPEPPRQAPNDNEILPFGAGMSRPVRIAGVEPKFTREALEVGVQGTMIVRCVIELDGSLQGCKVLKPVAHMETAVLSALATHRYRPIMVQGKPRRVSYVFNINLVQPK